MTDQNTDTIAERLDPDTVAALGRTAEAASAPVDDPEPTADQSVTEPTDDASEPTTGSKSGREAAKWRRQLREVEAERDALGEQLAALRIAEVQRIAAAELTNPAGLWAAGTELATLLADDGTIDAGKVTAACADAIDRLGLESARAKRQRGNYVPNEGGNPRPPITPSFEKAFSAST